MTAQQSYEICLQEDKRNLELEPIILTNAYWSYLYARDVIKGRWPESELIIKQDDWYWKKYYDYFNIKVKYNWKVGF